MADDYESYHKLSPVLLNTRFKKLRRPDMPVDVSAHEARVTVLLLRQDEEKLKSIGYDTTITDRIEEAAGTFSVAEAKLTAILGDQLEAVKIWKKHRDEGYDLRDQVLDALKFACREDDDAMEKLKPFPRRPKQEIMILNLHFLSELGKKYQHHLKKMNFDMKVIEKCKTFGDKLSHLYASAYSAERPCQMRVIRNKAFTLMKELMAQAREYVTYLFKKNSTHIKQYSSQYRRNKYRYNKKKSAATEKTVKTPATTTTQSTDNASVSTPKKVMNEKKTVTVVRSAKKRIIIEPKGLTPRTTA
ncbi:hypothetical protein QA601_16880 [Chitinispirillales bacterium ANBcel5]|uniref:hypothetical protein n=1 Tax=Cellulosispirillum alkaliphilum TaxID=3039283 RepID=UPI002A57E09E|nr:hypothetical protein [Chitinispirillales bacterium ANBcel5]